MKITSMSVIVSLAFAFTIGGQVFAEDQPLDKRGHDERVKKEEETRKRVERENKLQKDQDSIREKAQKGGYESDYDKSVKKYGGPRTKESVEKSKPHAGAGHTGDNDQPGLNGKEGTP
jgi:hypothetical protein